MAIQQTEEAEKLPVKVISPSRVVLSDGTILNPPVNRIIFISQEEINRLQSTGVLIRNLGKVVSKPDGDSSNIGKKVKPVDSADEKEQVPAETVEEKEEVVVDSEEEVKEPEEAKEEEKESGEEVKEEEVKQNKSSKKKEEDKSDNVTPEYIQNCNDKAELQAYAETLGIEGYKELSIKKLRAAIIERL